MAQQQTPPGKEGSHCWKGTRPDPSASCPRVLGTFLALAGGDREPRDAAQPSEELCMANVPQHTRDAGLSCRRPKASCETNPVFFYKGKIKFHSLRMGPLS